MWWRIGVLVLILGASTANAQDVFTETQPSGLFSGNDFFVAVISGTILALAFELLLTNLSAAAGLTALEGAIEEEGPGKAGRPSGASPALRESVNKAHGAIRKVAAGFGIWTVITASIALFFACWLAVELAGSANVAGGVILGLVIWGVFYILSVTLEGTAVASMVGALASIAKGGRKVVSETVGSIFSKSEESKVEEQAAAITAAVRDELLGSSALNERIREYIKAAGAQFGPERFRSELEDLLNDSEIRTYIEGGGLPPDQTRLVTELKTNPSAIDKEKARSLAIKLRDAVSRASEEFQSQKGTAEKAIDASTRAAGLSREEAQAARRKIEDFLRSTGKPELSPETIKRDIERLFHDPREGVQALRSRVSAIDRDTVAAVLSSRSDMSKEEVREMVDRTMSAIKQIVGLSRETVESSKAAVGSARGRLLSKVENYIASLDRPALDSEAVRREIELLFDDPKAGAEALLNRAKRLSRDDIVAMLASNRKISDEDAERIVNSIMQARDQAIAQYEAMKREIQRRMDEVKIEVMHQAEELRHTAAGATWWIFASATISGFAAAAGGWVAVIS
jgi:hypothetical protein